MAVLIEAKGKKRDGTAYLPYEGLAKQRVPVEVVDLAWLRRHWKEIKRSHMENERLAHLQYLRQAVDGKSSSWPASKRNTYIEKHIGKVGGGELPSSEFAASAVINLTEPVRKLMDAVAAEYAAGGFQLLTPGHIWRPPSPSQVEAAGEFMFSLGSQPRALLAAEMTRGLFRVKLCQWIDKNERRQFGLFCPDMLSAIYAAVAADGQGIAACLRCGGLFLRGRIDNQFCSPRCKNTYLTADRRRREKNRASKGRQRAA